MFGKEVHSKIFFLSLACLAASLPLSIFTTSMFQGILLGNWLIEGGFVEKWKMLKQRRSIWLILSIYLIFIAGLIHSSDLKYGLHDLQIKLPIILMVLVVGTSSPLRQKQLKWILLALTGGVLAGSVVSISVLTGIYDYPYKDLREISLFVSHIRFSLLIDVSIFSLIYMMFNREYSPRKSEPFLYAAAALWLIIFLFILQSISGILIFLGVSFVLFWVYLSRVKSLMLKWILALIMIAGSLVILSLMSSSLARFYTLEQFNPRTIDRRTENGRRYRHNFESPFIENGNYIWLYLCEPELEKEWNTVSDIKYDEKDARGNDIKYTLIRYLTSRGFRKDSVGVHSLSDQDIVFIQEGKANYLYGEKRSLNTKIYEMLWQIDVYRKGGNPSGHSVTQRILYFQAALGIISDNFWFGVGTGDVRTAYEDYYDQIGSPLNMRWRLRAHNQFLTFILTYGIIGFLWIIFSLIYPVFLEKKSSNYFIWMFLAVGLLSMLNEDTLETHTGVSFFAFFYALFLLGTNHRKNKTHSE